MGLKKVLRAINPLPRRSNDEEEDALSKIPGFSGDTLGNQLNRDVGYAPPNDPPDATTMTIPNRTQRLQPGYNPPPPQIDVGGELSRREMARVGYNPPSTQMSPATMPATDTATPPSTMADKYIATATPLEDTTRDRRVTPAPTGPGPARVIYGPQGQPRSVEGGADDLERQQAYLQALEDYKAQNHNSRLKSAAITGGRGYVRGGIVPGAVEFIRGLIDSSADEKEQQQVDVGKTSRRVGQLIASRQAQSKLLDDASRRNLEDAQATKALNPTYAPSTVVSDQGIFQNQGGTLTPLYNPQKPGEVLTRTPTAREPKYEVRHDALTGKAEKWKLSDGKGPDVKVMGWEDPKQDLVKRNGMWVSQNSAYSGDSLQGQRTFEQNRQTVQDAEKKSDTEQQRIDKAEAKKQQQAKLVGDIQGTIQRMGEAKWQIQQLQQKMSAAKPEEKPYYEEEIRKAQDALSKIQAEGTSAANELNTAHGDLYEAGSGTDGYPYFKIKPFSVVKWKTAYPNATPAQRAAAIQNAKDRGQEIVDDK